MLTAIPDREYSQFTKGGFDSEPNGREYEKFVLQKEYPHFFSLYFLVWGFLGFFIFSDDSSLQAKQKNFSFDAKHKPVLILKPGDTLVTATLDAFGNAISPKEQLPNELIHLPQVNYLTGPFYVEGAMPGDTLILHLEEVKPSRDFAVSTHLPHFGLLTGETCTAMLIEPLPERTYIWNMDLDKGVAILNIPESRIKKVEIPLQPFLGAIGVAPNFSEAGLSVTPAEHGGQMDCVETKTGTTLYFPVFVKGALFMLGDGHAAQGDGEICGTGLEIPLEVTVKVNVIKGKRIIWPRFEDDEYIMVAASTRPLINAFRSAHVELINWLVEDYGYNRWDALQLVSQVGVARVGNVVNPECTVVAKFPKKYLPIKMPWWQLAMWLLSQIEDTNFDAAIGAPAYTDKHPHVLFDEAHSNAHTIDGLYKPFVNLIVNDGFEIKPNKEKFNMETLNKCDILVIANARGGREKGTGGNPAFSEEECKTVEEWIRGGGSLLLIADHAPYGAAAEILSKRFSVNMSNGDTIDPSHHDPETGEEGSILFSRKNGLLKDHSITRGRNPSEKIHRVLTFNGQSLKGPEGSTSFLSLADTAIDIDSEKSKTSAAGRTQGIALEFGKGRIVILGEAAMLTAQIYQTPDLGFGYAGMNRYDTDNKQLAINIMHWLSRLFPP